MKSVPHFLRGPLRNTLKLALEESTSGNSRDDDVRPRMSLEVGGPCWGLLTRGADPIPHSRCNEMGAIARQRPRRRGKEMTWSAVFSGLRVWCMLVSSRQHSGLWKALEVAPSTWGHARQASRRPTPASATTRGTSTRDRGLPARITQFDLDEKMFGKNLPSARRGVAGRPTHASAPMSARRTCGINPARSQSHARRCIAWQNWIREHECGGVRLFHIKNTRGVEFRCLCSFMFLQLGG